MKFLSTIFSLLLSCSAWAATPVEIKLWDNEAAPTSNGIAADAEDSSNPDWVLRVSEPTVTVFPADNPNGTALLMCPGGAYIGLAMMHEGKDLAEILNDKGITLAVLKYRMPNGHYEVPADDARQALRLLRKNASEWGINPERIGISGASAGGHLASTVATHPMDEDSRVDFQVLIYPVISMRDEITHKGSKENLMGKNPAEALVEYYCNEKQVSPDSPRAFISTTLDDDVVPVQNTLDYFDALTANGVKATMHLYPRGGHGWAYRPNQMPYHDQWLTDLTTWLSGLYEDTADTSDSWAGKKVAVLGDSMSDPGMQVSKKRFYNYLAESVGIEPYPYAVSGYQWKDLYAKAEQLKKEHGDDVDAIFIWAGTNDFNASRPLGQFYTETKEKVNVNGKMQSRKRRTLTTDTSTFCGSINRLLGYLKTNFPEKQIVILTPIHRGYAKFGDNNVQPSEEFANGQGLYIDDYVEVLREAGSLWSVPVIDLFGESGLYPSFVSNDAYIANTSTDRLHPNDLGHKRIAATVERHLTTIPSKF